MGHAPEHLVFRVCHLGCQGHTAQSSPLGMAEGDPPKTCSCGEATSSKRRAPAGANPRRVSPETWGRPSGAELLCGLGQPRPLPRLHGSLENQQLGTGVQGTRQPTVTGGAAWLWSSWKRPGHPREPLPLICLGSPRKARSEDLCDLTELTQ